MSATIKHIAVIRLSAMGDVAMTVPLIRAFCKQHSEVKITVVSRPFFKPFFDQIPNVSFFGVDLKARHKGFFGLLRLYSDLRKLGVDAVADLHNVLRSKTISALFAVGGKKTAATNKARAEKKALIRAENKIFAPLKPVWQRHLQVFKQLGFNLDVLSIEFPAKQKLDSLTLALTDEKSGNWVGIAPFAQHQSKVYPADLMKKAIDIIAANPNTKVFLFGGGKSEIAILETFAPDKKTVITVAGKLSFSQELALISNLDVMLSMDSGNAHIAAMFGVQTITLWGATHPFTGFAPFNQPLENAIVSDRGKYPKLPTSVYGNKEVEGYQDAMRTINPETVAAKVVDKLRG